VLNWSLYSELRCVYDTIKIGRRSCLLLQQFVQDINKKFTCKSAVIDQNITSSFSWTIELWMDGYSNL
jgi:hypothetical protein